MAEYCNKIFKITRGFYCFLTPYFGLAQRQNPLSPPCTVSEYQIVLISVRGHAYFWWSILSLSWKSGALALIHSAAGIGSPIMAVPRTEDCGQ